MTALFLVHSSTVGLQARQTQGLARRDWKLCPGSVRLERFEYLARPVPTSEYSVPLSLRFPG